MATITATTLTRNGSAEITFTNAAASQTIGFDYPGSKIVLIVDNTDTTYDATITIKKGTYLGSIVGDLAVTVEKATKVAIGPIESVRFKDGDSEVTVTAAIETGGTLTSVKLGVLRLP